jgi:hypothetical protein
MYKRTQTHEKRGYLCADRIDMQRLRTVLKDAQISQRAYADACKLSCTWISLVLNGHERPGELGRIKMLRGLERLGLEREVCSHAAS